ncbi:hypothetical protein DM02DRAFT_660330 [Periconia macrospinosa]|uniref:HNH nuclease domain-containing protein n=1 Tax=Periconia macrospinosa TaxID=97972 RepID=A0A2V1DAX8_9PLEO|nr:hypothetical protein DM02DRAFT_660330 [Periconia macrospinosa]
MEVIKRGKKMSRYEFDLPINSEIRKSLSMTPGDEFTEKIDRARKMSETYSREHKTPQELKKDPLMSTEEWSDILRLQYDKFHRDTLTLLNEMIEAHETYTKKIQTSRDSGNMPQAQALSIIDQQEREVAKLRKDRVILLQYRYQFQGSFIDEFVRRDTMEKAYIDLLISRFESPEGYTRAFKLPGGRDQSAQNRFRKDLISSYGSEFKNDVFWCPITKAKYVGSEMVAANLVDYNVGESNCDYIFGSPKPGKVHLMAADNGLFIHHRAKKLLDTSQIMIRPALNGHIDPETGKVVDWKKDHIPLKVVVLNKELCDIDQPNLGGCVKPEHLDGRVLEFLNDFRPKLKYLWFRACSTVARRERAEVAGYQNDIKSLGTKPWYSPGDYIRKSVVFAMWTQVARRTPEEAEKRLEDWPEDPRNNYPYPWIDTDTCDRIALGASPLSLKQRDMYPNL